MDAEARLRNGAVWARSDDGARWGFRAVLVVSVILLYIVGRHQWFIRDDWQFVFTRDTSAANGWASQPILGTRFGARGGKLPPIHDADLARIVGPLPRERRYLFRILARQFDNLAAIVA